MPRTPNSCIPLSLLKKPKPQAREEPFPKHGNQTETKNLQSVILLQFVSIPKIQTEGCKKEMRQFYLRIQKLREGFHNLLTLLIRSDGSTISIQPYPLLQCLVSNVIAAGEGGNFCHKVMLVKLWL